MNADTNNGGDAAAERALLFQKIAKLTAERNELQTLLAQCRSANRALRAELGRDK